MRWPQPGPHSPMPDRTKYSGCSTPNFPECFFETNSGEFRQNLGVSNQHLGKIHRGSGGVG